MFLTIKKMYSCLTELFKIEVTICVKMDLALNNLQSLICHKTQPTNHSVTTATSLSHKSTYQKITCYIFILSN